MGRQDRENKVLDRLYEENRSLKKEIKSLKNSIRRLSKGYSKFRDTQEPEDKIKEVEKVAAKICFQCHGGELQLVKFLDRYWRACNACLYRTKSKLIKDLKE